MTHFQKPLQNSFLLGFLWIFDAFNSPRLHHFHNPRADLQPGGRISTFPDRIPNAGESETFKILHVRRRPLVDTVMPQGQRDPGIMDAASRRP
jgi:hypothetical protein